MSNKREVQGLEVVASLHQHLDGRKRIQVPDGMYDQDAGWGAHVEPLVRKSDADTLQSELNEAHSTIKQLEARNAELLLALIDAAQSLATISKLAGKDEFMCDLTDTRSYAKSRAGEALRALTKQEATQ